MVVDTKKPDEKVGDIIQDRGCVSVVTRVRDDGFNSYRLFPGWRAFAQTCLIFAQGNHGAERAAEAVSRLLEMAAYLDEMRPLEAPSSYSVPIREQFRNIVELSERLKEADALGLPLFDDDGDDLEA